MGAIKVHESTTVDGVVDVPMWTADHGFPADPAGLSPDGAARTSLALLGAERLSNGVAHLTYGATG